MRNLSPVEIPAEPPQKSRGEQTQRDELDIFAVTLGAHRENHNILGRPERLLQLTSKGKKTVLDPKRGYTDNAEL
jgi:hypothetical protein